MRILLIGTVKFSADLLEEIVGMGVDVVGVCTRSKSTFNADFFDLGKIAVKYGIPCWYTNDINSSTTLEWIKKANPDVILCVGWSQIIGEELLEIPSYGIIGFHPSELPRNRGRHPITWALVLGLESTATTFFLMDSGTDTGDLLSQERIVISNSDNAQTLYEKVTNSAKAQVKQLLQALESKSVVAVKQDHSLANVWRRRNDKDGEIDWRMSALSIHNLIRGLFTPYIGAHFVSDGVKIKVWESEVIKCDKPNFEPGKVIERSARGIVVKCGHDAILLKRTSPEDWQPKEEYL